MTAAALRTEEPAVAVAMSRCLTARSLKVGREAFRPTTRHPRACGWCDYPVAELQAAVIEFNNWAEYDDRHSTSGRHPTRVFAESSPAAQEALVVAAQGLVDEEPMPPGDSKGPDVEDVQATEEEISPWHQ